ncbi:hypothetical protein PCK2_000928 [Pneumocystis canis]|nr:hypothetical protein PCK2_000928 [Pneumocystis canis]
MCEKKLTLLATPSIKKKSEIYTGSPMSQLVASSERKIGENKLLSSSAKKRYDPIGRGCTICKQRTHHLGAKYCPHCAYKRGQCNAVSVEPKFLIQACINKAPDESLTKYIPKKNRKQKTSNL